MTVSPDFDPGGKPVDPGDVARELRQLWRELGANTAGGVTRALMLNFAMHLRPGADVAAASRTVARVTAAVPARAFVLAESAPGAGGPPLAAWISSHCVLGPGGKQVCCEQITLAARSDRTEALASQLLALLVPDLSTVLWWPDGGADPRLLARLARDVDRVVVDSSTFPDPESGLCTVAGLADRGTATATSVDDVAWSRLDSWRDLTAGLFDEPPFDRLLATVHSARIVHTERGAAQAWLYAGWLASRLGWRPRRRRARAFDCESPSGNVELRFDAAPDSAGDDSAHLVHVRLQAAESTAFDVEIDRAHPSLLTARVERPSACPRPQQRDRRTPDRDRELVGVLQRRRPNPAYAAALVAAAHLCEMTA